MSYKAIICRIRNVREHPNAERLRLATVSGYQIVVGPEQEEDQLGIFFASDGQLSKEFCRANALYRKDPDTGEAMGGYFERDRRVRVIKLRGQYSEGFWIPMVSLDFCGRHNLQEGDEVEAVNGIEICRKYMTTATKRAIRSRSGGKKIRKESLYPMFREHYDTKQLRSNLGRIPQNALIYISEKVHGTSGRTGRHMLRRDEGKIASFWSRLWGRQGDQYAYVSGSRRVVLEGNQQDGYYRDTDFRQVVHDRIASLGLYKGETLYYEIVGYHSMYNPIMGRYDATDKEMAKAYGKKIVFSYGCEADGVGLGTMYRIMVYRITLTNEDGVALEYAWEQIRKRCAELGLDTVPLLQRCSFTTPQDLLNICVAATAGSSTVDSRHPIEGVVIRVEHPDLMDVFKFKGNVFCDLEGIKKNDPTYVDTEEIA